jgi:hypothetical protein
MRGFFGQGKNFLIPPTNPQNRDLGFQKALHIKKFTKEIQVSEIRRNPSASVRMLRPLLARFQTQVLRYSICR